MPQFGWPDCPPGALKQIEIFVSETGEILGSNLLGIYLHGSLAMGCFNPERSDIDLLVVTYTPMETETKRDLAALLLQVSGAPHPIEISFMFKDALDHWEHPTPFDLHFGEGLREPYAAQLSSGDWRGWNATIRKDADLAGHLTIINHRGVCLQGTPIANVFPPIPAHDYRASILADVQEAHTLLATDPVYIVLNLCRVLWYVRESAICSKDEGGAWGVQHLPAVYRPLVVQALAMYRGETSERSFEPDMLADFATYMLDQIGQASGDTR